MFKANVSGRNKIWEGTKNWGALPPKAACVPLCYGSLVKPAPEAVSLRCPVRSKTLLRISFWG